LQAADERHACQVGRVVGQQGLRDYQAADAEQDKREDRRQRKQSYMAVTGVHSVLL
jgi:hypothetical protein